MLKKIQLNWFDNNSIDISTLKKKKNIIELVLENCINRQYNQYIKINKNFPITLYVFVWMRLINVHFNLGKKWGSNRLQSIFFLQKKTLSPITHLVSLTKKTFKNFLKNRLNNNQWPSKSIDLNLIYKYLMNVLCTKNSQLFFLSWASFYLSDSVCVQIIFQNRWMTILSFFFVFTLKENDSEPIT